MLWWREGAAVFSAMQRLMRGQCQWPHGTSFLCETITIYIELKPSIDPLSCIAFIAGCAVSRLVVPWVQIWWSFTVRPIHWHKPNPIRNRLGPIWPGKLKLTWGCLPDFQGSCTAAPPCDLKYRSHPALRSGANSCLFPLCLLAIMMVARRC